MSTAVLTSKGQTTIPKDVRDISASPGDRIEFVLTEDKTVLLKPATRAVTDLKGFLPKPPKPVARSDEGRDPQARRPLTMIGIDTNVLVRYVVQDDARQAAAASQFIEMTLSDDEPGWIASVVLCEFVWVLEAAYGYARNAIAATLERLFEVDRFRVEAPSLAWRALDAYRNGADFADALIALGNEHEGCDYTATFDRARGETEGDAAARRRRARDRGPLSRLREGKDARSDCPAAGESVRELAEHAIDIAVPFAVEQLELALRRRLVRLGDLDQRIEEDRSRRRRSGSARAALAGRARRS